MMKKPEDTKVIIGLSGGVDSAVAAYLLQEQGYQVEALFMKNWEEDDDSDYCSAAVDLVDAKQICEVLDIPLRTVQFSVKELHDGGFITRSFNTDKSASSSSLISKGFMLTAFLFLSSAVSSSGKLINDATR